MTTTTAVDPELGLPVVAPLIAFGGLRAPGVVALLAVAGMSVG